MTWTAPPTVDAVAHGITGFLEDHIASKKSAAKPLNSVYSCYPLQFNYGVAQFRP